MDGSPPIRAASLGRLCTLLALLSGVTTLQAACGDDCVDADSDGAGEGCGKPDCDDNDPSVAATCDEDCRTTRNAVGCPCVGGKLGCYPADPQTVGIGLCVEGENRCIDGAWGECVGAVVPVGERCNGEDDDCDGTVDEFVQSPCGGCDESCIGDLWGSGATPFEANDSLVLSRHGELMLAPRAFMATHLFVPNGIDRTVSRIDAESATETARYRLAGAEPTRVAIDHLGDAWILSPAQDGGSVLTRIAGDEARCSAPARTSTGPDDVLPLGEDDCVTLSTTVGGMGEVASSLSIDGSFSPDGVIGGSPWVGFEGSQRVAMLDPSTGEELRSIALAGRTPNTSTFGPGGELWIATRDGHLVGIDLTREPPELRDVEIPLPCFDLETIAAGPEGRLYMSGFACENLVAYDPLDEQVQEVLTEGVLTTRGIALWEGEGFVVHTSGAMSPFERDPLQLQPPVTLATGVTTPLESIGAAADGLGHIWVVSFRGGPDERGVASRFDVDSASVDAQVAVGRGPRALGDFTGNQLHTLTDTEGSATHVFRGCRYENPGSETTSEPTSWTRAHLTWIGAPGGSAQLEARHAAGLEDLADAQYAVVGTLPDDTPPFALDFPDGGYLEVRLTLRTEQGGSSPRIQSVGVEWVCPGPE